VLPDMESALKRAAHNKINSEIEKAKKRATGEFQKGLERLFRRETALSPKQCIRIVRLTVERISPRTRLVDSATARARRKASSSTSCSWSSVAVRSSARASRSRSDSASASV